MSNYLILESFLVIFEKQSTIVTDMHIVNFKKESHYSVKGNISF
jgi:hypothetical protein